jgi:NAD(P)-dependent dehydrogenase (short-subunit alcohol dehydrogenase family)
MNKVFGNRIALVTGGGSGIGRSSAIKLARAGSKVVVADVNTVGGESTVHIIHEEGGEGIFIQTDVSQLQQVEALVSKIIDIFGRLDFAHNNAGILGSLAPTADCTYENWMKVIDTNLTGVWLCMKYEISAMLKHKQGAIVNTSSVFGLLGSGKGIPAYVASKHGINGITKAAAMEYAKTRIRINAICPGKIATPMQVQFSGSTHGRKPDKIGDIVVWLSSDAALAYNGCTLTDVEWLDEMQQKATGFHQSSTRDRSS